jgi:purine-binding chemotaxis protein CheW
MKQIADENYSDESESEFNIGVQYLSFMMDGEEYAIDIQKVMEIRCYEKPTELPSAPSYLKGVINLRGTIIPIIDLRERFHIPHDVCNPSTVVIILQIPTAAGDRVMGMIVDAVSEVYHFPSEHIHHPPELTSAESSDLIDGLATIDNKMIIILNVDMLFSVDELSQLDLGKLKKYI